MFKLSYRKIDDCGPFLLAFLWALSKGKHPRQFEHNINGHDLRRKIKDSLESDRFIRPTTVPDKVVRKITIKTFPFDTENTIFRSSGRVH